MVLPGYSAHFEVNYSDRLPATVRVADGRFMTVVREAPLLAPGPPRSRLLTNATAPTTLRAGYKRDKVMLGRYWRLVVRSGSTL